jgi:uncharacterized peroxidase-related enzyme
MAFLQSPSADVSLLEVFKAFPDTARPLIEYHEVLMRGDSPLSVAQRELIAAYVSGLNACSYCHGVHQATAEAFGVGKGLLAALLHEVDSAPVEESFRPLLRYVRKLTLNPHRIAQSDADAVFAAGWSNRALHDAVCVCGLFNLMNRMVSGLGVEAEVAYQKLAGERLAERGYARLLAELPKPRGD